MGDQALTEVPYEVRRSDRRTMALELTREGKLLVRVPRGVSEAAIRRFVAGHADWIRSARARLADQRSAHPEPGESERREMIARAKAAPDRIITASRWIGTGGFSGYSRIKLVCNWIFEHGIALLYGVRLTDMTYAYRMGVWPTRVTVTSARTRFGSCSPKNALSFSWRLMDYPEEAIDYVVVHELAHIRFHDHSPAFYAFISSVMPDHKRRREMLRH